MKKAAVFSLFVIGLFLLMLVSSSTTLADNLQPEGLPYVHT